MVDLEGVVAQIKGYGQKETITSPHSFEVLALPFASLSPPLLPLVQHK
jgi:hypothetical protein